MKSSSYIGFPSKGIDPTAPLGAPFHWLAGSAEHILIGFILGWLGARAMRRLSIRWTWAALGFALIVLARPFPGGADWTLGLAMLVAAVAARRRSGRDLACGGDIAAAASAARGPHDTARQLARAVARRWRLRSERWFLRDGVLLGYDSHSRPVVGPLNGPRGGKLILVVGATGSGKTVTQTWMLARGIEAGLAAVVIDPKGDPALERQLSDAAAEAGTELIRWSPDGPSVYNPFAQGTDTEIVDRALAGELFTEPHYLRQAQRYLGHAVQALRHAGTEVSLAALADQLDPGRLEVLLRTLPEGASRAGFSYLDSLTPRQRADLAGVRDRLAVLAESDVGRWLDPRTVGVPSIDLLAALRSRAVVLFTLQSDRRPLLMQMLGSAIVLDLQSATSAMQATPVPSIVAIDEFAALAAGQVGGLFGRARGAGMSVLLATQEISDLRVPGREHLLEQVDGNLSALIAHRQANPASARWISEHAGTAPAWSGSLSSDGRWTGRRADVPRIAPEQVRSLDTGQAAVVVYEGPSKGAAVARMLSCQRRRATAHGRKQARWGRRLPATSHGRRQAG